MNEVICVFLRIMEFKDAIFVLLVRDVTCNAVLN